MAGERQLVVKFVGDVSSLKKAGAEAEGSLNKLSGVAKAAAGAFAAGFVADKVVGFLEDSAKAAQEDLKSQALLATQLRTSTGATDAQIKSTEDFINKLERATGVADDDLRPALASLARGTKDSEAAQRELAIAMDIAAARGVDLTTVSTAIEKAHNGNTTALSRLGIATKDAEGNTLSLEQAMAGAAETYKGAAEAAVTPGQRMSVAFNELKEQVGTALLPALNALSTYMADTLLPAFQNAVVWLQDNWPQISKTIGDTFDKIKPFLAEFVHSVELAFDIIRGIFEVVSDLLQGHWSDAWRAFRDMIVNVWGDIGKLVGDKIDQIKTLFGGLISWFETVPGKLASAASGMWDWIWQSFKDALNKVIDAWNSVDFTFEGYDIPGPGPNIPGFTFGLPDIPHVASGGYVAGTGLAVIHKGETVVPADVRPSGGMQIGTANIYLSGVQNVDQLAAQLSQWADRQGGWALAVRTPTNR